MTKIQIVFLFCWLAAMLGLGVMKVGFLTGGKVIAYGFGVAAMLLGLYSFVIVIRNFFYPPTE